MKKSLQGTLCAYCGKQPAMSKDHVIGKGFLPIPLRGNLPEAPACGVCHNRKSAYEHYAMTVFPFGSMHPAGDVMLQTKVKDRLDKNQRLWRELRDDRRRAVGINSDGSMVATSSLPFDHEKSFGLFRMIIQGLLWHHCRSPLPHAYTLRLFSLTDRGLGLFKKHILSLSPGQFHEVSLADGAFGYQFTRNPDDPFFTAWVLDVYNSLNMFGIVDGGRLVRVHVMALSGPPEVNRIADAIEAMGIQPELQPTVDSRACWTNLRRSRPN